MSKTNSTESNNTAAATKSPLDITRSAIDLYKKDSELGFDVSKATRYLLAQGHAVKDIYKNYKLVPTTKYIRYQWVRNISITPLKGASN